MAPKRGEIMSGHPFVKVMVSNIQKTKFHTFLALVDTAFIGFVAVTPAMADSIGLEPQPNLAMSFTLADGKKSVEFPGALGYACLEGDDLMEGTVHIADKTWGSIGVEFFERFGATMIFSTKACILTNEAEMREASLPLGFEIDPEDLP